METTYSVKKIFATEIVYDKANNHTDQNFFFLFPDNIKMYLVS